MDVTAQVLHDVEFREAKRGGYNTQDVDEFLERLAVGLERQEAQVREARQRVAAAEARAADAERRAEEAGRHGGSSEADETLKRTLVLAQRTADAAIREAEERAARTVATAEDEAARLLAEAHDSAERAYTEAEEETRRAQDEARRRVLAELQELEEARDHLRADVEVLERHIDEQRDRLRLAVREMQALIDDPAALREVSLPVLSGVDVPAASAAALPSPRQLVAEPAEEVEEWDDGPVGATEDDGWPASGVEPEAYHPPPAAEVVRRARDDVRGDGRPLLAESYQAEQDDDVYLAELRKAMTDDRPLGPRDDPDDPAYQAEPEGTRSRFGRRR
ncbi:MAG: DivIVA domain-containing protein [Acidimicrobiales bacterium]|nr:DivIVA domain-containing protein [Acidimicrobiales bacterium]